MSLASPVGSACAEAEQHLLERPLGTAAGLSWSGQAAPLELDAE